SIALDPERLAKLKPFVADELRAELADAATASRFIYVVPNLCNDQHGAKNCNSAALTLTASDEFLETTIPMIVNTPAFTDRSVLFVTFDDSNGMAGCCGDWIGGGRVPLIAVTKHPLTFRAKTP